MSDNPPVEPSRIELVRLVRFRLPLVTPFRTSAGVEHERDVILVHVVTDRSEGWGENVAQSEPTYTAEFVAASELVLRAHLVPRLLAAGPITAAGVAGTLHRVRGWEMAKAAIEAAVLDAELRATGTSLADHLGATRRRVAPGVAVGLTDEAAVLATIERHLADGYHRVKLKIEPGCDVDLVASVRNHFGPALALQVDANGAYDPADHAHTALLAALDRFGLLFIEQPYADDALLAHRDLARHLSTPICLDEPLTSPQRTADALAMGACAVVNVKPGRLGGLLAAKQVHDLCLANGAGAWVGGMLETGVGRAANLALAALPGFGFPPDLSASSRYFATDVTTPFELDDGHLDVPTGPGIGVTPDPAVLRALNASTTELRP